MQTKDSNTLMKYRQKHPAAYAAPHEQPTHRGPCTKRGDESRYITGSGITVVLTAQ